jgi:hypothetical protein
MVKNPVAKALSSGGAVLSNKGGPSLLGRGLESRGGNAQGGQTIDRTF